MYHDELRGKLDQLGARAGGITMTIAEFLEEKGWKRGLKEGEEKGLKEGEEKGLKEGEEKGLKEGEEKGRADTLRRLLLVKFKLKTLDAVHEAHLRAATPDTIDRYVERVLFADSLAAVFED
jgi:flagellar biosynthesis/type III secretory pathway protein FliH